MLVAAFVGAADLNPLATVGRPARTRSRSSHLPSSLTPLDRAVLFQIRLPRIVLGVVVGGLLSVAGAGYQGVFRNPLVDSGMLGASAGAGPGRDARHRLPGRDRGGRRPGGRVRRVAGRGRRRLPPAGAAATGRDTATLLLAGVAVGMLPDRGADLRAAALGPGHPAGLHLAARLAVRPRPGSR